MPQPENEADFLHLRDRFAGALLGTLIGDVVGAPVEGADSDKISDIVSGAILMSAPERELARALFGPLTGLPVADGSARYTDDTQMMIGLAESLIERPEFDADHLAGRFADNFDSHRGYGPGAHALLRELRKGSPWQTTAQRLFGGRGSFGNGGAMRVAPVGALFHDSDARLREVAARQARVTHAHPLGVEGAVLQAAAVAVAMRTPHHTDEEAFDRFTFLNEVERTAQLEEPEYIEALAKLRRLLAEPEPDAEQVGEVLGNWVEAHRSVPSALYAFLTHPYSFPDAVLFAIGLGGDTDTIGAMSGAISGAFLGAEAIPEPWLTAAENGAAGRDYIRSLADSLFKTWREMSSQKGSSAE